MAVEDNNGEVDVRKQDEQQQLVGKDGEIGCGQGEVCRVNRGLSART